VKWQLNGIRLVKLSARECLVAAKNAASDIVSNDLLGRMNQTVAGDSRNVIHAD